MLSLHSPERSVFPNYVAIIQSSHYKKKYTTVFCLVGRVLCRQLSTFKIPKQLYLYSMETDVDHHLFVRKMEVASQDHE